MKRRVGSSAIWLFSGALALASCSSDYDSPLFPSAAGSAGAAATSGGASGKGGSAGSGNSGGSKAGRGGNGGASAGGSSAANGGDAGMTGDGGADDAGGSSGASGSSGGGSGGSGGTAGSDGGTNAGGNGGTAGSDGGTSGGGNGGTAGSDGGTSGDGGAAAGGQGGNGQGGAGGSAGTAGNGGSGGMGPDEVYVGPNGSDLNPGTLTEPFATVAKGQVVARAGTTIWVLPGTYQQTVRIFLNKSGTANAPIKLYATAGARPLFDFSGQPRGNASMRGIEITGNFWHVRGLELEDAADNGILISGSDNVIEDVRVHGCEDTGIQITVSAASAANPALGANNLILNCDSYENFDELTNGENADGFAAKLRIGPGNVFSGCRAWNNADDGFDFFAADDVVTVQDSWAFLNGLLTGTATAGDGDGFKLGGVPTGPGEGNAPHVVDDSASFENKACGYDKNGNTEDPEINQSFANANFADCCGGASCADVSAMSMTGAAAMAAPRNPDGSLHPIN